MTRGRTPLDLRMLVPAAAAWIVTIVLLPAPGAVGPVAAIAWAVSAGLLVGAIVRRVVRRSHSGIVLGAIAFAATAMILTSLAAHEPGRRPADVIGAHQIENATVVVAQTVTHQSRFFDATLVEVDGRSVSVPVTVFGAAPRRRVEIGTTLAFTATVRPTPPAESSSALLFADDPARIIAGPPSYLAWANGLRTGLAFAAAELPGDGARLLPGLAIGDTVSISPSLTDAMKASSLTHLTAVSGANCAVVIGLVLLLGRAAGVRRGVRIGVAVVVLVAFVVLVTPQPSVLRAAVMATLVLIAMARGRPASGVPVVAVAILALLVYDPWLVVDYGFALSVLATLGLMVLAAPIAKFLGRGLPAWLAMTIAVPTAAQLACQPVLFLLSPTVPIYGVLANLLAEPAAPVATVIGLLGCVALAVAPGLGQLLVDVAWLPASWIAGVARFFAGLPGARLPWPGGLLGLLALVAVTVLVVVLLIAPLRRALRRAVVLGLVAVVVAVMAFAGATAIITQLDRPSDWQVAACDIGQGDAMVVRSAGKIALMDTGPSASLLADCLKTLGIRHIDLLVLSHFDLDHVAGTSAVDGMVTRVLLGPSSGQPRDRQIVQGLIDGGARVDRVSKGVTGTLGDLTWSVRWPLPVLDGIEPGNDACVTVLFEPTPRCREVCLSSLFLGDLGAHAQDLLLESNPDLPQVDVIEVAHHGSADQSEALYQRVRAAVGLIGVGRNNRYGHPTRRLLDILSSVGTTAERTDRQGLVVLGVSSGRVSSGRISTWSQRSGASGRG